MPTTATAFAPALTFATADSALACYDLARATGAHGAYEAAAHALASALRGEAARRHARAAMVPAALRVVSFNPDHRREIPNPKASKPRAKSVDLDERFKVPLRRHDAGAFVVSWEDGTETRLSAVGWPARKPGLRFALAYQAANRLRRLRSRKAYLAEHGWEVAPQVYIGCGLYGDSQEWLRLNSLRPMAALAGVRCENTGEVFTPPPGSRYGAGDPEAARVLESEVLGGTGFRGATPFGPDLTQHQRVMCHARSAMREQGLR